MEDDLTQADFSGYATRADITCTDGRTITADAFAHQNMIEVPLVWHHQGTEGPQNILGHAVLEHRDASHPEGAGMYCYAFFNETENGQTTKALVHNKDVKALSIFANGLVEKIRGKAKEVLHGAIQEVSIVLSGANPGAFIDNIRLQHGDGEIEVLEAAYIYTGLEIQIPESAEVQQHAAAVEDKQLVHAGVAVNTDDNMAVYDDMTEKQKEVVQLMVGAAIDATMQGLQTGGEAAQSDSTTESITGADNSDGGTNDTGADGATTEGDDSLTHQEGSTEMTRNLFQGDATTEAGGSMTGTDTSHRLTHAQLVDIVKSAKKSGSFKEAVLEHAGTYGIDNIELLFPDAKAVTQTPEWISRRMEWVASVLNGTKHSPFAAVKTLLADITKEEARAKGYVKGTRKVEEVFELLQRTTRPATIYKKQKLDRDDMLDITDINVVNWLKAEMRLMIEEELARAILVGDNRLIGNPERVKDPRGAIDGVGIRSILHDDDLFAIKKDMPANVGPKTIVKELVRAMDEYKGSGNPTLYIARSSLTDILLEEDRMGRALYANRGAVADAIGVGSIVTVDLFSEYDGLFAIIVSLQDYTVGTNAGGELTPFEDFDIDFNQYKYLQETRLSGGLTKPFSAIVVKRLEGTAVTPTQPSFNGTTKKITIPTKTGVSYFLDGEPVAAGETAAITDTVVVEATPNDDYYFPSGTTRTWTYNPA